MKYKSEEDINILRDEKKSLYSVIDGLKKNLKENDSTLKAIKELNSKISNLEQQNKIN